MSKNYTLNCCCCFGNGNGDDDDDGDCSCVCCYRSSFEQRIFDVLCVQVRRVTQQSMFMSALRAQLLCAIQALSRWSRAFRCEDDSCSQWGGSTFRKVSFMMLVELKSCFECCDTFKFQGKIWFFFNSTINNKMSLIIKYIKNKTTKNIFNCVSYSPK